MLLGPKLHEGWYGSCTYEDSHSSEERTKTWVEDVLMGGHLQAKSW